MFDFNHPATVVPFPSDKFLAESISSLSGTNDYIHSCPLPQCNSHLTRARVPQEAHTGAGLLAGHVTPQRTKAGAVCCWRNAPHGRDPHWGSSQCELQVPNKNYSQLEGLMLENFSGNLSHGITPIMEKGKNMKRKEWQGQNIMNWLQPPLPTSLPHIRGRK